MFFLYFLGRDVESILGQKHFLYLYLGGLIVASWASFPHAVDDRPARGHGGVAAVLVAFATDLAELEVSQSLFFVVPLQLKAKYLGNALFAVGLVLVVFDRQGVVSHSALLAEGCRLALCAPARIRPESSCNAFCGGAAWEGERLRQMSLDELSPGDRSSWKRFAERPRPPDATRAPDVRRRTKDERTTAIAWRWRTR